jgi:hypothetical protein
VRQVFAPQSIATVPLTTLGSVKLSLDREYDLLSHSIDILLPGL